MGGLSRWNWPDIKGIHDYKVSHHFQDAVTTLAHALRISAGQQDPLGRLPRHRRGSDRQDCRCYRLCKSISYCPSSSELTYVLLHRDPLPSRLSPRSSPSPPASTTTFVARPGLPAPSPRPSSSRGAPTDSTTSSRTRRRRLSLLIPLPTRSSATAWSLRLAALSAYGSC